MWHGILVDVAFDKAFLDGLKAIGRKEDDDWVIMKIELPDQGIGKAAKRIQDNMKDGFYSHLYAEDGRLIIIFKNRMFDAEADRSTWKRAIEYGKSVGIPAEQLDFYPCKFEDETY